MPLLPSDLARALLARVLDPDDQDAIGDLDEDLAHRVRASGRWPAEVSYLTEAISLGFAALVSRLIRPLHRVRHDGRRTSGSTMDGERMMGGLLRDLRHAVRGLLRDGTTTTVIVATLAVAIGATTAIFAVADAAFLRTLPYPDADRLVRIYSGSRDEPAAAFALSPLDLRDLEGFDAVIADIGAWTVGETVHLTDAAEPRRLEAPRASAGLFRILGVQPELGRFFSPDEETPGDDDEVVLSHALWVSTFGADSGVVGRSIVLDDTPYRVVGIAPAGGMLPRGAEAWRALALGPEWYAPDRWGWQFLDAVARLRPGVDAADVSSALTTRLAAAVPNRVERGQTRVARTLYDERVGETGPAVLLLFGAVVLLLAMACANVMNVILARSERRTREFGLRRALGSGAVPLLRLVMLETGVLALSGGAVGILLSKLALRALRASDLPAIAYLGAVRVDLPVAAFALALTALTAGAFGVAPALRALRTHPRRVLQESGTRAGSSRSARRLRDGLVVAQVAIACVLLVAVGLSGTAFASLLDRDPGFRARGILTAGIELPANAYPGEQGVAFYRSLLERVRALPGVKDAGAVEFLPLSGVGWSASIELIDPDPAVSDPDPGGNMRPVSPGYFGTMGIPVLQGRDFTDTDDTSGAPVVIVDRTLAQRYWPGGSPVGRRVVVGALSREPATIVGVVGSVPDESLATPGRGQVYFPVLQRAMRDMTLVVRADGEPTTLAPPLRAAIREADPRIPIVDLSPLDARVQRSMAAPRVALILLTCFGAVAVLLAAVGIYGVLTYAVARRTGEIGTRMALGATPPTVRRWIVLQAMRLWGVGTLIGGTGALGTSGVLGHYVVGARATDPLPYGIAFLGLGGVALLAALLPAVRATSVDPARALRSE